MSDNNGLSNDELWDRASTPGSISAEELGVQNGQSNNSGIQVVNEGVDILTYGLNGWNESE